MTSASVGRILVAILAILLLALPSPVRAAQPAAQTPAPPIATPAPALAAAGPSAVLLRDDFADPRSGWPRRATAVERLGYADREYQIVSETGAVVVGGRPETFDDFRLEVEARVDAEDDEAYVFVNFRRGAGGFYRASLYPNRGGYLLNGFRAQAEGAPEVVLLTQYTPAAEIQRGGEWNRLGVQAEGADLVLLVNDTPVAWVQDDALRDGRIELGVSTNRRGPAEARFRNYVVSRPEPAARPAPQRSAPPAAAAGAPPGTASAPPRLVPRPELALALRDLPPGYEEVGTGSAEIDGTPAPVHQFRRPPGGLGPVFISSVTFEVSSPLSADDIAVAGRAFAASLARGASSNAQVRDWDELDPAGLGEQAVMYTFQLYFPEQDRAAGGALAVFSRGEYLSFLVVLNLDGRATADLRQLASIVDVRLSQ